MSRLPGPNRASGSFTFSRPEAGENMNVRTKTMLLSLSGVLALGAVLAGFPRWRDAGGQGTAPAPGRTLEPHRRVLALSGPRVHPPAVQAPGSTASTSTAGLPAPPDFQTSLEPSIAEQVMKRAGAFDDLTSVQSFLVALKREAARLRVVGNRAVIEGLTAIRFQRREHSARELYAVEREFVADMGRIAVMDAIETPADPLLGPDIGRHFRTAYADADRPAAHQQIAATFLRQVSAFVPLPAPMDDAAFASGD